MNDTQGDFGFNASRERTIDARFSEFHLRNPIVYETLVRFARQAKARGHNRLGIRMLWERMRWELFIETHDPSSDFKLNDHYHSRFARLIMEQESDLADIFHTRELRAR